MVGREVARCVGYIKSIYSVFKVEGGLGCDVSASTFSFFTGLEGGGGARYFSANVYNVKVILNV